LLNGGYISVLQVQQQELQLANADGQARGLARQELEIQQRLEKISYEIKQVPLTARARLNDIERQRSQHEQALARNEAERSIVLKAPVDAVITAS
ncbi:anibiotic ABC transporter, partial [Escherichia coli]